MFSPRIARLRNAIILALAVLVWSDAALASFVCSYMSGGEHGIPVAGDSNAGTEGAGMPCCPVKHETSMQCEASMMECCAWHHRENDVSAILLSSDQAKPKQLAAVLPPAIAPAPKPDLPGRMPDWPTISPISSLSLRRKPTSGFRALSAKYCGGLPPLLMQARGASLRAQTNLEEMK